MRGTPQTFQALVVGGGLVGKAAALALTQIGMRVALLAQPAHPLPPGARFDSRVYAFSSSSQTFLERLRVWQAIDASKIGPVYDMRVYGDANAELHFSAFQAAVPQLAWIVESNVVEHALDTALRFQPQLNWLDARAQGLEISDAHATVSLDNGETLTAGLVIGADGAQSWVRAQMGAKVERRDYQQTGVVANFRISRSHGETATQWFTGGEIVAMLPLAGPYASLVWSARTAHAQALLEMSPEALTAALADVVGDRFGTLECVTPAQGFPLALQTVDRLVAPRVALVGDAAHLIHPLAGQGMNLGLRDVASLVDTLGAKETFRDVGDPILLRRYERSRREDIQRMMAATDGLQRLFALPGPIAKGIRNAGLALVGAQPQIKRWLVSHALG
ncbi:UbiH/UbiF family hydroxylase [Pararobbsia silviterrae]|uniref:UbiH/UbiF family hydroxylase n=1 Tax=Pararobbsia silviterrae TaxID=1792498 RepID=A0A494XDU2_9BURK|nr:UbiH/UbiF family hydroxylase [Pararobbsia silviterrae]RKP45773.1 UbiH/UbiF family hydroxylase [Pararobbsia silviterrae]